MFSVAKAAKHATDVATISHSPSSLALMAPGWASSPPISAVCAKVSLTSAKTVTPVVLSKLRRPLNSLFLRVVRRRDNFPDSIAVRCSPLSVQDAVCFSHPDDCLSRLDAGCYTRSAGRKRSSKIQGQPTCCAPPKEKIRRRRTGLQNQSGIDPGSCCSCSCSRVWIYKVCVIHLSSRRTLLSC